MRSRRRRREARVVVAEAFMYRHHPQTRGCARSWPAGGWERSASSAGPSPSASPGRATSASTPPSTAGALWDVGCYPLSFARTVLGEEPVEVMGVQRHGPTGVDLTFAGQLRFPSGVLGQLDCSFEMPFRTVMEIVGAEATLTVPQPFKPGPEAALLLQRGETRRDDPTPPAELYLGEVEDMADAILDGKPPRVSLGDSRANVSAHRGPAPLGARGPAGPARLRGGGATP